MEGVFRVILFSSMKDYKMKLTFYGGVGWVTGANFLLETLPDKKTQGVKILVDCGMFQGGEESEKLNKEDFAYNPQDIDALVVTHAHADHIGRIPKLVRDGFKGTIYSTEATYDLAKLMLKDAFEIVSFEAQKKGEEPYYSEADLKKALSLWKHVPLHSDIPFGEELKVSLFDAGHILGSAMAVFSYGNKKIVFTGDLGNSPDILLKDTEIPEGVDYMVIESVYGDRNHENREDRIPLLRNAVLETIAKKGTLLIPSFALERTQVLLFLLNELIEKKEVPELPIFLDTPLGIDVTDIFRKHSYLFNSDIQNRMKEDTDIFSFPGLKETYTIDDSKSILRQKGPKIIISSAGMSHAGRIIHHHKQYLGDPSTLVLFVGYQSVGTLGRIIQDGAKKVTILGKEIPVRAKIETISGYSAHKDSQGLLDFVNQSSQKLKHVFVAMGELKSSLFLVQRIRDYLGIKATAPDVNESVVLDMN